MSTQTLLTTLFQHKAWADKGLIAGLAELRKQSTGAGYDTAIRILQHAHIVDRIFVAHLHRMPHIYAATDIDETPALEALSTAIEETDQWYIGYIARLSNAELVETIAFTFTDGTPGRMSREEMLAHVIAHSGYHRGEVGRILTQLTSSSPRDTLTGYLHEVEPERREQLR